MLPFTNIHTHVFTSNCAPDRFLMIIPSGLVRRFPDSIKSILDSTTGKYIIQTFAKLRRWRSPDRRREIDKYMSFLNVGTQNTQLDVFKIAFEAGQFYDKDIRIVGLTMNMDFMDTEPSTQQISFESQLEEIKDIKRFYPKNFFPFLGVDPRHKSGDDLKEWARPYFEHGVVDETTKKIFPFFSGIKLYPALGFFPFDPRLESLYAYAAENDLPVMTHCTRVGSQYIGNKIEHLIPKKPGMIALDGDASADSKGNVQAARESIEKRIDQFYKKGWVKNSDRGANDIACDLFGHPENYIPILEKFPNLKICLAHMGGTNEILNSKRGDLGEIRKVDKTSWFETIKEMMRQYPNLYTDISYTLSDFGDVKKDVFKRFNAFLNETGNDGTPFSQRVMFGTDFFMTEQEKREVELYDAVQKNLGVWFDVFGRVNPQKFLMQPV